jgi:hypothetical protein
MDFKFSIVNIIKIQGELPQKESPEYKQKGLKDIDKYILNRLSRINEATLEDLNHIIDDAVKYKWKKVSEHFKNKDDFRAYCLNKFQGKLQTIHFHGNRTKIKGFDIMA